MALKVASFKFEAFSKKQKKVLTWWLPNSPHCDKDIIIADGAVRYGKTIGSFRRNVLAPLKRMLRSLKYRVKEHRVDNMVEITYRKRTNFFYIFGGKDERSQDLIQGITLAGMLFDEVALMPESFVNQATARLVSMVLSFGLTVILQDLITGSTFGVGRLFLFLLIGLLALCPNSRNNYCSTLIVVCILCNKMRLWEGATWIYSVEK